MRPKNWYCIFHETEEQKHVMCLVSLTEIQYLVTDQVRTDLERTEVQLHGRNNLESHNIPEKLQYPGEYVTVKDKIEVALKQPSLPPQKSFMEDPHFIEEGPKSGLYCILLLNHYMIYIWACPSC